MKHLSPSRVVRRHEKAARTDWGPFAEQREADRDGNYMSVQNLKDIHEMSGRLMAMINRGDAMEDWVEDKISAARQIVSDLERFYTKGWGRK